jgi:hypothetical protein
VSSIRLTSKLAHIYRKRVENEERAYAVVRGKYAGPAGTLRSDGRTVPVDPRGDFGFLVPIRGEVTRIPLSASAPNRGTEEETLELSVPNWQAIHRDIQRLPVMREEMAIPPDPILAERFRSGIGADFGSGFYIPFAAFDYALTPRWSVGLRASYASTSQSSTDQTGIGAFVNATYYLVTGTHLFQGLFVEPQAGVYRVASLGAGTAAVQWHPDLSLCAGWRPAMGGNFQLGIGGGIHYVFGNDSNLSYTGFFPGLMFDAGFRF